jgi:Nif-specific regulatory protein
MERIAFLCPNDRVEVNDLAFILSPDRDEAAAPTDLGLTSATARFQQDYIRRMVKRVQGNMTEAARVLGLHRSNLYRKMRQLEMAETPADEA